MLRHGFGIALAVAGSACVATPIIDDDGSGSSGSGTGTQSTSVGTSGATMSSSGPMTSGDPTGMTTVGSSTLDGGSTTDACADDGVQDEGPKLDVGAPEPECDLFAQDCPEGEKCVPDDFWTRLCMPIDAEPIPAGEPCEIQPFGDHCDASSWCALPDPDTGLGTCVLQCTGSWNDPLCPPDTICVIDDEQVVAYCAPPCDPFGDECLSLTCQPTARGFGCLEGGPHGRGDGCVEDDSCQGGLVCRDASLVPGCCGAECCAPLCSDAHPCKAGSCHPLDPPVPGPEGIGSCG